MPNRTLVKEALVGTPVTIYFQDLDGTYRWFENPQSIWAFSDRTGDRDETLFTEHDVQKIAKAKDEVSASGEPRTVEVTSRFEENGKSRTFYLRLTLNRAADPMTGLEGYVCSCIDISEQRQREQTLRNLLREVAHRSKNLLAMVLSLSAQTARVTPSKEEYVRRFTGRLQSIAKSQDVITERDWRGSTLSDLVRTQVMNVVPFRDGRIAFSGDDIELAPNGTVHVGLALHELVANALVHGALTVPGGSIRVECRQRGDDHGAVITWVETPRVQATAPRPKSFGRTMLERIVPAAVGGKGELELNDESVTYTLTVSRAEIV